MQIYYLVQNSVIFRGLVWHKFSLGKNVGVSNSEAQSSRGLICNLAILSTA